MKKILILLVTLTVAAIAGNTTTHKSECAFFSKQVIEYPQTHNVSSDPYRRATYLNYLKKAKLFCKK